MSNKTVSPDNEGKREEYNKENTYILKNITTKNIRLVIESSVILFYPGMTRTLTIPGLEKKHSKFLKLIKP